MKDVHNPGIAGLMERDPESLEILRLLCLDICAARLAGDYAHADDMRSRLVKAGFVVRYYGKHVWIGDSLRAYAFTEDKT